MPRFPEYKVLVFTAGNYSYLGRGAMAVFDNIVPGTTIGAGGIVLTDLDGGNGMQLLFKAQFKRATVDTQLILRPAPNTNARFCLDAHGSGMTHFRGTLCFGEDQRIVPVTLILLPRKSTQIPDVPRLPPPRKKRD